MAQNDNRTRREIRAQYDVRARRGTPRMTLTRVLRSELMRLARSPLMAVHLVCGIIGGAACGAYFAVATWDPTMGADAFAQFLGALMPLMSGIACGLAVDEERTAAGLANLTAVPARGHAVLAKLAALAFMGGLALAVAFGVFGAVLAAVGRLPLGALPLVLAWAGALLGSLPIYALMLALALRFGRNAAIGIGAVGTLVAFFSVGGLAHGLMTGELTGAMPSILGVVPFSWAARLGSLGVESVIAAGRGAAEFGAEQAMAVTSAASGTALACAALSVAAASALALWFRRFEEGRQDA